MMLNKTQDTDRRLSLIEAYTGSMSSLLESIGVPTSNRDPLSEFAERLVVSCVSAELVPSRVQKGWDLSRLGLTWLALVRDEHLEVGPSYVDGKDVHDETFGCAQPPTSAVNRSAWAGPQVPGS